MKTIKFEITGTTPIMLNNPQTVNPMNAYAKAMKEITSKRTKTDDDQQELLRLKFIASCYINNQGRWVLPANMLYKSIEAGAKENKLGKKFEQCVSVLGELEGGDILLQFANNGNTPEEIWDDEELQETYVDIRAVGIMKSKVITARCIIPEWKCVATLTFDENVLNDGEVWNAINAAGLRHGIGTYRQCYGRYKVEEIKEEKKLKKSKKIK